MQETNGKIQIRDRAKLLRDFTSLKFGSITPTDIDGFIEYQESAFIFMEIKGKGAQFDGGQKLAFERLTDTLGMKLPTIFIIAEHTCNDPEKDIDVGNTIPIRYRWDKQWLPANYGTTRELIKDFLASKCGYKGI